MAGFVLGLEFEKACLGNVRDLLETLLVGLYVNEHDPGPDDTTDMYEQPEGPWYELLPLDTWGSVVETDDGIPAVYHPAVGWEMTSGNAITVEGIFVVDKQARFCWAFPDPDRPVPLFVGGEPYRVTPRFTLRQDPDL